LTKKAVAGVMSVLFVVAMMANNTVAEVKYNDDCTARCVNGRCNAIVGRTLWADEGEGCKPIEEIKNLMDTGKFEVITQPDGIHGLEITWFNYSCIKYRPYVANVLSFEYNKNIPLKLDSKAYGYVNVPSLFSKQPNEMMWCFEDSVLSHNYSFGDKSTTIQLQDANTENLDDSTVHSYYPNREYGARPDLAVIEQGSTQQSFLIKFNISSIPIGSDLINSSLYLYQHYENLEYGDSLLASSYHVYHYPIFDCNLSGEWTEGTGYFSGDNCTDNEMCYSNLPNSSQHNATSESSFLFVDASVGWVFFPVLHMTESEYQSNSSSLSIYINYTSCPSGYCYGDTVAFRSKEYGTPSLHPYLNLTYVVPDTTPCIINKGTWKAIKINGTCWYIINNEELIG
jgi:hypothetical protein